MPCFFAHQVVKAKATRAKQKNEGKKITDDTNYLIQLSYPKILRFLGLST